MHKMWLRQLENDYMIKQAGDTSVSNPRNDDLEQQSLFNGSITSTTRSCRSLASIPFVDTQREMKQAKRMLRKAQKIDPRSHGIGSPGGHIARVYTPAPSRRTSHSATPYKYGRDTDKLLSFGKYDMSNLPPWNRYFMRSRPMSPKETRMQLLDYEEKAALPSFSTYITAPATEEEGQSKRQSPRSTARRPSAVSGLTVTEKNVWTKQIHALNQVSRVLSVSDIVELSSLRHPPACISDHLRYLSICIGGTELWPDARTIVFQDINALVAFIKSADPTCLPLTHLRRAAHFLNSRPPYTHTEKISKACVALIKWISTFHSLATLLLSCDGRLPTITDTGVADEQNGATRAASTVPRRGGISLFAETYHRQDSTGHSMLGRMHSVMLSMDDDDDSIPPAPQVMHSGTVNELIDQSLIIEPPPDVVVDVTNAYMFYECDIRGRPLLDGNGNFIPLKRKDLARYKDMLRDGETAETNTSTGNLTASDVMFGTETRTKDIAELERDEEMRQEAIQKNKDFVEAVVKAQLLENSSRTPSSKHNSILS